MVAQDSPPRQHHHPAPFKTTAPSSSEVAQSSQQERARGRLQTFFAAPLSMLPICRLWICFFRWLQGSIGRRTRAPQWTSPEMVRRAGYERHAFKPASPQSTPT
ncbi:hypothetical protein PGT21_031123 [Puccinia graminis f. sp. tritici]|uniref:Uncharacterized protein n=1 Tax=Puccinia graminis f. sp. tritici TaxID=56615 RepID=A0A5B0S014_PUCGR|nr:hypothetical protein PGT21_031123 [Puccinia graminis f. sp. tritici]KAA1131360.1 hypothetical protein PGTUg99_032576 [Puccinia graminis f. sp. tritici]